MNKSGTLPEGFVETDADVLFLEDTRRKKFMDEFQPEDDWSPIRVFLAELFRNTNFEVFLLVLIACNFVTSVYETNARARGDRSITDQLVWVNRGFLIVYGLEMLGRMFVLRLNFCQSRVNVVDGLVVLVDISFELVSIASGGENGSRAAMLRIIRIGRFLRAGHIIVFFPELYWMTRGMVSALKALLWGVVLIAIVLMMWSIAAVEVIHPMMDDIEKTGVWSDCPQCHKSFESVAQSLLTFFGQIVAGDSWAKVSDPVIRHSPWQTAPILLGALFSINLGVLNLILAVIVDRAQQAHAEDLRHVIQVKHAGYAASKEKLISLVETMDIDKSGEITFNELSTGYETHGLFRATLEAMDIGKEDMGVVFNILDADSSGSVDYGEFAKQLHKMKTNDSHTMLVFIQYYVKELREQVKQQLRMLADATHSKIDESHAELLARMMDTLSSELGRYAQVQRVKTSALLCDVSETASASEQPVNHDVANAKDFSATLSAALEERNPGGGRIEGYAELAQLRHAVSELTDAIHAASNKSLGAGLDLLEPKRLDPCPNTVTAAELLTWTPAQSSPGFSRHPSGSLVAQLTMPGREEKMQSSRCCDIRFASDGLLPVRSV